MQRIRPKANKGAMLKKGQCTVDDTLSELGIYGTFIRKGNDVILNNVAGQMMRTKVLLIINN